MSITDPTARNRQLIEFLLRENYDLRKEIDNLRKEIDNRQQDIDRWRNLALAFCYPNECQDETDRLLFRFLSKRGRSDLTRTVPALVNKG